MVASPLLRVVNITDLPRSACPGISEAATRENRGSSECVPARPVSHRRPDRRRLGIGTTGLIATTGFGSTGFIGGSGFTDARVRFVAVRVRDHSP